MKKTIVFIHGMYMTPLCWENWIAFFQSRGYDCLAPAWPGREASIADLRAMHPDPELGHLTLRAVVDSLGATIRNLKEKPVVVGHSMGGLVVQLLLQQDLAAAGVAIDSAPPQGVFTTKWSFLKSNFPHINPLAPQDQPIRMSLERFQYTFVNGLPPEIQRAAYDRYVVPESRRVPAQSLGSTAHVDFRKPHAPLFLVAGSADHIIPAALNRSNFRRYQRSTSLVEFKVFPGRTHFTIGQPGWEKVAEAVKGWIETAAG